MTVTASGVEGAQVELVDDRVVITREGLFASLRQGRLLEIPLSDISDVILTAPAMGIRGVFVVVEPGKPASGDFLANNTNPRSVYFTRPQQPEFERLRAAILARLSASDVVEPRRAEASAHGKPVVLILTARPRQRGLADLNVDLEEREILEELRRTPARSEIDVRLCPATTADTLLNDLFEARPTVVHFSGHGVVEGLIIETVGRGASLAAEAALARMFRIPEIAENVRILVLNACLSATQAQTLSAIVPAVIGTLDPVLDSTAIAFSQGFYNALGHGVSVASAFAAGVSRASLECGEQEAQKYRLFSGPNADSSTRGLVS